MEELLEDTVTRLEKILTQYWEQVKQSHLAGRAFPNFPNVLGDLEEPLVFLLTFWGKRDPLSPEDIQLFKDQFNSNVGSLIHEGKHYLIPEVTRSPLVVGNTVP